MGGRSARRTFATATAPPRFCGHDSPSPSGTLTVDCAAAGAGETLALTLLNTGSECLRTSALVALRREDGTRVPLDRPFTAEIRLLQPGSADSDLVERARSPPRSRSRHSQAARPIGNDLAEKRNNVALNVPVEPVIAASGA